jgi:hypothetical protein
MEVFCQLALERPELMIETSAHRLSKLSACCAVVMVRMSFSCWYILSTLSVEGAGIVSKSATTAATFWLTLAK